MSLLESNLKLVSGLGRALGAVTGPETRWIFLNRMDDARIYCHWTD